MLHFHANFYARPTGLLESATISLRGIELQALRSIGGSPAFNAYFPVTFEGAVAAMQLLTRLDVEPDGFFVQFGESGEGRWQINGHLFDFHDRLYRVQLNGSCPAEELNALLGCFGAQATDGVFELVQEGVLLGAAEFMRWADAD